MKQISITNAVKIKNRRIKPFDGEKNYLATGGLIEDTINTEVITYKLKPTRADLLLTENQLIVARMKGTNKVLLIDKDTSNLIVSTGFLVLEVQEGWHPRFLFHYLVSSFFQKQKDRLSIGATQKAINNEKFKEILIPEISYENQKRIVKILDEANNLRQKRKQAINLLDEYLKSVFLEMFGDPIKNDNGWKTSPLGEYLKVKHGLAFKSEYFSNKGNFILLTPGNFYEQGGYKDRGVKQKYYIGDFPKTYILTKNDLLVAMTEQAPGLLGSLIFIPESNKFLHNQRLGLLIYNKAIINRFFIFYLFNHPKIRKIIYTKATGTKVRHTSPTKLEAINVAFPPIALQNQFEIIVEKTEYTKQKMLVQSEEIEKQFQALIQRSFHSNVNL